MWVPDVSMQIPFLSLLMIASTSSFVGKLSLQSSLLLALDCTKIPNYQNKLV